MEETLTRASNNAALQVRGKKIASYYKVPCTFQT